jgi:hypothetical protein
MRRFPLKSLRDFRESSPLREAAEHEAADAEARRGDENLDFIARGGGHRRVSGTRYFVTVIPSEVAEKFFVPLVHGTQCFAASQIHSICPILRSWHESLKTAS